MALPENPITRKEAYLAKIAGQEVQIPDVPITREEAYLNEIAKNGGGGGGYTLPTATANRLGGVKIGSGISVEEDGTISASGGGGTTDYDDLTNKPSINDVELSGNKTASELGLQNELTFDDVPTDGSNNPVKSGGVYASDEAIRKWTTAEAKSVSGNPITLTDGSARNAEALSVELEPIQDLHGYDKPWAGGAGKNKLPLVLADIKSANTVGTWSGNVYSIGNVTFELLTDSDNNVTGIKVNGTNDSQINLNLNLIPSNITTTAQTLLTGSPAGAANNTYCIEAHSGIWYADINGYSNSIPAGTIDIVRLSIRSGASISNLIFYPMLRLASVSDATFEPYTNECPISGLSSVNAQTTNGEDTHTATISFGQTVYGGSVDFKTGKVMVTHGFITLDGDAGTNYGFYNPWASATDYKKYMGRTASNVGNKLPASSTADSIAISDKFNALPEYQRSTVGSITASTSLANALYLNFGEASGLDTTEKQLAWLTQNPVQVCYELATPIELTLTPAELELLKGYNYISTNGTTIALAYLPDSLLAEVENYVDDADSVLNAKIDEIDGRVDSIEAMSYHTESNGTKTVTLTNAYQQVFISISILDTRTIYLVVQQKANASVVETIFSTAGKTPIDIAVTHMTDDSFTITLPRFAQTNIISTEPFSVE